MLKFRPFMAKVAMAFAVVLSVSLSCPRAQAQVTAVKSNALYWLAGGTANLSAEVALSPKVTVELMGAYNPWSFKDDKKMKLWLVQPEVKYWLCEKFQGHFVGLHAHGGEFYGGFRDNLYDGHLIGGGLSYGYDWILSKHWNLEAEIGVGYAYMKYKQSPRLPCIKCQETKHKNYIGPTKAAVAIGYVF